MCQLFTSMPRWTVFRKNKIRRRNRRKEKEIEKKGRGGEEGRGEAGRGGKESFFPRPSSPLARPFSLATVLFLFEKEEIQFFPFLFLFFRNFSKKGPKSGGRGSVRADYRPRKYTTVPLSKRLLFFAFLVFCVSYCGVSDDEGSGAG